MIDDSAEKHPPGSVQKPDMPQERTRRNRDEVPSTQTQPTNAAEVRLRFFEDLAHKKEALSKLNGLAEEYSLLMHGRIDTQAEFLEIQNQWSNEMDEWTKQIEQKDPKLFRQIETVAKHISTSKQADKKQHSDERINWIDFYNNLYRESDLGSVETFVAKLRTMPRIRENIRGMEALSQIFGAEVHQKLFGGEVPAYEQRRERSKRAVDRAFEKGKIDEVKRNNLLQQVHIREDDVNFQINNIEIDSKFIVGEKKRIYEMLRNLPPSLRKNIKRIYRMEKDAFGAGCQKPILNGASEIGLKPEAQNLIENDSINLYERFIPEGIFYHEILGHGLRHLMTKANKQLRMELNNLLTHAPAELLRKDLYARRYLDDDPELKSVNVPRDGIPAEADEFWANRIAEWWGKKKNQPISLHRDPSLSFTEAEQIYVDGVCEKIFATYLQASGDKM